MEREWESALELSSEQHTPPAVNAQESIAAALVAVPGSVTELDLDADIGDRFERYIDATTSAIIKQERETDQVTA